MVELVLVAELLVLYWAQFLSEVLTGWRGRVGGMALPSTRHHNCTEALHLKV